jgi:uncharacterized OB-fold protein
MSGTIYTETTVFSPPEAYLKDAPYQLVIVTLDEGGRVTARVLGDAVRIGDRVVLAEKRNGVPYFQKA